MYIGRKIDDMIRLIDLKYLMIQRVVCLKIGKRKMYKEIVLDDLDKNSSTKFKGYCNVWKR